MLYTFYAGKANLCRKTPLLSFTSNSMDTFKSYPAKHLNWGFPCFYHFFFFFLEATDDLMLMETIYKYNHIIVNGMVSLLCGVAHPIGDCYTQCDHGTFVRYNALYALV